MREMLENIGFLDGAKIGWNDGMELYGEWLHDRTEERRKEPSSEEMSREYTTHDNRVGPEGTIRNNVEQCGTNSSSRLQRSGDVEFMLTRGLPATFLFPILLGKKKCPRQEEGFPCSPVACFPSLTFCQDMSQRES